MFPSDLVGFFEAVVRTGFTVLVSGGPGAGKTTFLVELCGLISPMERLITAEKALLELRLEDYPERHPNVVALHTRQANSEGVGEVAVRSIVELTRRLNPDRVIVGELVEDEALDMLDAASMCKRGSMATIHAHRPEIALTRLAYYVAKSNTKLPEYAVWNQIAGTIDFVVHIDLVRNQGTGRPMRRVTSIREIAGLGEAGGVASTELFGLDEGGQLVQRCAIEPGHARQMVLAGFDPTRLVPTSVNEPGRGRDRTSRRVALSFGVAHHHCVRPATEAEPVVRMRLIRRLGGRHCRGDGRVVAMADSMGAACAGCGAMGWWVTGLIADRDRRGPGELERVEALATWTEQLRDVLMAGDQPIGAIQATVATCPEPVRPQVRALASRLGRQPEQVVLRQFADDLDDPTAV
jgi:hypothetical protein